MPEISNDDAMTLFRRGEHFQRFGELDAAEEALQAAIKTDSSFAEAWNLLGLVYQDSEKTKKSLDCFLKAITLRPKWTEPVEHLGLAYYSQGKLKEAIKTLNKYLDLGGRSIDALFAMAKAAIEANDCRSVLSTTAAIIEVDDTLYEVWEMRGVCQARLSRYNAACTSLNVAIDLNYRAVTALNTVGDLCYNQENYDLAVEFYSASLSARRSQPDILFRHGTSLWFLDRWAEAIPILEKYIELVPDDPRGWNNLGVVLREKGEVKRSIECYKRALEIDAELEAARQNLGTTREMQVLL
jgi:tetratricopeptide (TPR) repeat protein